ncbi:MAG: hypothetical protein JSW39_09105 [Desulfobacterales bacterium]|nr:MAG: hypothetical protein JSW39_09105 [Desulfobacterales bacterium]
MNPVINRINSNGNFKKTKCPLANKSFRLRCMSTMTAMDYSNLAIVGIDGNKGGLASNLHSAGTGFMPLEKFLWKGHTDYLGNSLG